MIAKLKYKLDHVLTSLSPRQLIDFIKHNKLNQSDKKDILFLSIYASLCWASFTSSLFVSILYKHTSDPMIISFALVMRKVVKIGLDWPIGVIMDTFGSRKIMIASRVIPILCTMFILSNNLALVMLAIVLHGASVSTVSGKVESRIYNILKRGDVVSYLSKVLSATFVFGDIIGAMFGLLGAYLYTIGTFGEHALIAITIVKSFICAALIFKTSVNDIYYETTVYKKNIADTIRKFFFFVSDNRKIVSLLVLWGVVNFFGLQFSHIASMIFIDTGMSTIGVGFSRSMIGVIFSLGSILSFFVAQKTTIKHVIMLWFLSISVMFLCILHYQTNSVLFAILLYCFLYSTMELSITRYLEAFVDASVRTTATSLATTFSGMFGVTGSLMIGFFAEKSGSQYQGSMVIFLITCAIIVMAITPSLININKIFLGKKDI